MYLFIFGCTGSSLPPGLFSHCGEWGLLYLWRAGFSLQSMGSGAQGLHSCGHWVLEHSLRSCGTVASLFQSTWDSSWTRDWACVCYIGRQTLYHWATREAWVSSFSLSLEQVLDPREPERNNAYCGERGQSSGLSTVELQRCCFYVISYVAASAAKSSESESHPSFPKTLPANP